MSCVDVYADVPSIESDLWSDIATTAVTLDRDDFLESGYPVDEVQFPVVPGSQSTPSSTKMRTRSTTGSPSKRAGKKRAYVEEEEEEDDNEDEDDDVDEGLDAMPTPGA